MVIRAVLLVIGVGFSSAQATEVSPKFSTNDRAVFCGHEGHETSAQYASTVNREVTRRITAGARTPNEALAQMRLEYCLPGGGAK